MIFPLTSEIGSRPANGQVVVVQPRSIASLDYGVYAFSKLYPKSQHLLPLPVGKGERLLKQEIEFTLPSKILHSYLVDEELDALRSRIGRVSWMPSPYICISRNIGTPSCSIYRDEESPECGCTGLDQDGIGCGPECLNRIMHIECVRGQCHLGTQCSNQVFQRRKHKAASVKHRGDKGWGLILEEDVKQGDFIIEYVGEIIDVTECERRLLEEYDNDGLFYFLNLYKNAVIDATRRGNIGRFLNHSCDPNTHTQKWNVAGELRVGIFAIRDIEAGTELTFDYMYERLGTLKQKCLCGAATCRGYLGAKKPSSKVKLRYDSSSRQKKHKNDDDISARVCFDPSKQMDQVRDLVGQPTLPNWFLQLVKEGQFESNPNRPVFLMRNLQNGFNLFQQRLAQFLPRDFAV